MQLMTAAGSVERTQSIDTFYSHTVCLTVDDGILLENLFREVSRLSYIL